jgi:flagellar hook-associated protein 3 FlgL
MRVTFSQGYSKFIRDIGAKNESLARLAAMASSGKRLTTPSDDPLAWAQSMDVKHGLRELNSYSENIEFALGWNRSTESALDSMSDVVLRAKNAAVEFASATSSEEQEALAKTLDQAIEEAMGIANTRYGDSYLFGGKNASTAPFSSTDYTQYNGNTDPIEVRTGASRRQEVDINGREAFFTDETDPNSSMLQTLVDLRDAIRAGDTAAARTQMSELDAAYEHLTNMQSLTGTRMEKMEHQQTTLDSLQVEDQTHLSKLEDVDLAEVITRLTQQRTALEAALKVSTYMNGLNLAKML